MRDGGSEVVCVSSTQVGKTFAYACKLAAAMWEYRGIYSWWWTAPTYKQGRNGQRYLYEITSSAGIMASGPRPPFSQNPPPPLVLINGACVEFRTWDDPSNLMGDPIAGAVIDEGGLLTGHAQSAISSRRSYTLGPLWWIGNPGIQAGPFRRVCANAESEGRLHRWTWRTLHKWMERHDPERATAYAEFIDSERRSLPDYEFRRLYEAEWTEDEAAVFRGLYHCIGDEMHAPSDSDDWVIGVDVAQSVDYLVAVLMGKTTRRLEVAYRSRGIGYPQAAAQLHELAQRYKAPLVVEANGPGVAVIQELQRLGATVLPYTTTSQSKQELILTLAADIQERRITLADHPPMPHEFSVFRYERMPSGLYRYSAPDGEHDDCVMAAAFARYGVSRAVSLSAYGWIQ